MKIPVVTAILKANDQVAEQNRALFEASGVGVANIMGSPGAGKTSLILAMVERLPGGVRLGVVEGDVASSIDAEAVAARGVPVVQVNTGGGCHLDAPMVRTALPHLSLKALDVLLIENVGNLICPANYRLGSALDIVVGSVPEGDDKPWKYPGIFASADAVILNKVDLAEVLEFDRERWERGVRAVNPSAPVFLVSCRTGEGLDAWTGWLAGALVPVRVPAAAP